MDSPSLGGAILKCFRYFTIKKNPHEREVIERKHIKISKNHQNKI
jgi:hypothetical protein